MIKVVFAAIKYNVCGNKWTSVLLWFSPHFPGIFQPCFPNCRLCKHTARLTNAHTRENTGICELWTSRLLTQRSMPLRVLHETEGASVVATNRPGTDNAAAVCEFRYTLVWTRKYADCWAAHSPPEIKCVGTTSDWHWWWSSVNLCWKRSRLYYVDLCRDKCVLRSSCHALEYTSYIPILSIFTQWKRMSCFTHWSIVSHFTH